MGQGLFLAVALLLARQPDLRQPNRLLAALLLLFVLVQGHAWLGLNGWFERLPALASAIAPLPLLIGPLLWLALRGLVQGLPLSRSSLIHGVPFAIALLFWLPVWLQAPQAQPSLLDGRGGMPWPLALFGAFKALHIGAYLWRCQRDLSATPADAPGAALLPGLRRLNLLLGAGLALAALLFAIESLGWQPSFGSDLAAAMALTLFVYGLAFLAMRQPLGYRLARPPLPPPPPRPVGPSRLSDAEREQGLARLRTSMEQDHAYRDGELSLEQLASRLALSPHELSQLINQQLGSNFQDYVNGFRVKALQQALRDPRHAEATILELALAEGFNSKSSLNRVFKKHTGMTPSAYRERPSTPEEPGLKS